MKRGRIETKQSKPMYSHINIMRVLYFIIKTKCFAGAS